MGKLLPATVVCLLCSKEEEIKYVNILKWIWAPDAMKHQKTSGFML